MSRSGLHTCSRPTLEAGTATSPGWAEGGGRGAIAISNRDREQAVETALALTRRGGSVLGGFQRPWPRRPLASGERDDQADGEPSERVAPVRDEVERDGRRFNLIEWEPEE